MGAGNEEPKSINDVALESMNLSDVQFKGLRRTQPLDNQSRESQASLSFGVKPFTQLQN